MVPSQFFSVHSSTGLFLLSWLTCFHFINRIKVIKQKISKLLPLLECGFISHRGHILPMVSKDKLAFCCSRPTHLPLPLGFLCLVFPGLCFISHALSLSSTSSSQLILFILSTNNLLSAMQHKMQCWDS